MDDFLWWFIALYVESQENIAFEIKVTFSGTKNQHFGVKNVE